MASRNATAASSPDDCIARLYGALGGDASFEEPLRVAAGVFRSHISGLHDEDFRTQHGRLTLVGGIDADDFTAFNRAYDAQSAGQNLWMERSLPGFLAQGYQRGDAVVGDRELLRSSYYAHFLRPLDIRHGLAIRVCDGDAPTLSILSFHRSARDRAFDADDIARVRALRPHLSNAYAIWRRTLALETRVASLRDAFDRTACGIAVLDGDARLVECNAAAERLLFGAGVASRRCGRLVFADGLSQRAFECALRQLGVDNAVPASLRIAAKHRHDTACVVHLRAVPRGTLAPIDCAARVLLFVAELGATLGDDVASTALQTVLGITPSEARVALALRRCIEIGATARECGIAVATTRVHLKSLHAKTGVRRNAELVALVERVVASLPLA